LILNRLLIIDVIKKFKPTTASNRHTVLVVDKSLSKDKLPAHLERGIKYSAGRSKGKISTRHKGGRVKRVYRIIDFKRDKFDVPAKVVSMHYDPYRTANIALVNYADGDKRLILATKNMKVGDEVLAGKDVPVKEGNFLPLKKVPSGSFVHNVELQPGKGGKLGRSAGAGLLKQGDVKDYVQIKMPSGEIRLIRNDCFATIGEVGNDEHLNTKLGKAGRKRKLGIRPTVRGVAQSYKHPHGGGQGKSGRVGTGGPAKTPWGKKQGTKTRNNKQTNKFIIKRRTGKTRPNVLRYKTIV
jgi:large subunit ribosomal protein L2